MAAEVVKEEVYSTIPMRTWRWLGVNEARVASSVLTAAQERRIRVPAGEKHTVVLVYRDEPAAHVQAELAAGAELQLIKVQLAEDGVRRADTIEVQCSEGAKFSYTAVEAGAGVSTTKLLVALNGDKSEADVAALYFGDRKRRIDMNYIIRQAGRDTRANMQIHGALAGESDKIFRGTLDFIRGAKGSTGREKEEVVLLSPKVRNRSVPLMLSGEDDVDGHHAVSVGRMDENKLYYLMSRGLNLAEAERLVVEAALAPVLVRIPDAQLAAEVREHIEGRLSHV
jgi:Fe-S cluster assembly protein SufD